MLDDGTYVDDMGESKPTSEEIDILIEQSEVVFSQVALECNHDRGVRMRRELHKKAMFSGDEKASWDSTDMSTDKFFFDMCSNQYDYGPLVSMGKSHAKTKVQRS